MSNVPTGMAPYRAAAPAWPRWTLRITALVAAIMLFDQAGVRGGRWRRVWDCSALAVRVWTL